nr:Rh blood group D antigen [Homo sapiens]
MSSKYPRSVRRCLPLWALTLEAALILLFYFFTHYDASLEDQKGLVASYQVGQDLTVMAAIGLGFLTSSFRRHSWSSVAFNLFMLALGVQWAILLDGFLSQFPSGKVVITLFSIRLATMSALSVLISVDAVLGKVNLAQLVVMVLVEVTALGNLRMVISNIFNGCCNRVLGIPHSSIMGYNFSLLGLLGEIIYIVLLVLDTVGAGNGMIGFQVLLSIGELSLAIVIALTSGLLTGLLLNLKIWKAPHEAKYFDDQVFWKFPHLAVGF